MPTVHILDTRLAHLSPYPRREDNDSFRRLVAAHLCMSNTDISLKMFKTSSKADPSAVMAGPYVVRGHSRESTKAKAILQFLREADGQLLKLPRMSTKVGGGGGANNSSSEEVLARELAHTELASPSSGDSSFVHYVHWRKGDSAIEKVRDQMYRGEDKISVRRFVVTCGNTGSQKSSGDVAVCEHQVESMGTCMPSVVEMHIRQCLHKEIVSEEEEQKRERALVEGGPESQAPADGHKYLAVHPYFHSVVQEKNGMISLTKDELRQLTKMQRNWYELMLKGKIKEDQTRTFHTQMMGKLLTMFHRFRGCGFDMRPFSFCKHWPLPHLIKFFVCPPAPRWLSSSSSSPPTNLPLALTYLQNPSGLQNIQTFAYQLVQNMRLTTNGKKGAKRVNVLVFNRFSDQVVTLLDSAKGENTSVYSTRDQKYLFFVEDEEHLCIGNILGDISQLVCYPKDTLLSISKWNCDEDEVDQWISEQHQQQNRGDSNSSMGDAATQNLSFA